MLLRRPVMRSLSAGLIWLLATTGAPAEAQTPEYDTLFQNGRVLDGTGNPFTLADVAVKDGRIAAIGQLDTATAARVINAQDLYVVPGFIDMHSHGGPANHRPELRNEHNSVAQGITTAVHNPDGGFMWPIADHVAQYDRDGVGLNVVMMVGHNKIRQLAMGDAPRAATPDELEQMKALLRQGLDEGAWGMTLGLEGVPGRWSTTDELVELARVLAERDAFYHAHQRAEGRSPRWWNASTPGDPVDGIEATRETIEVGERSGARVMATHFKVLGKGFWGSSDAMLRMLDEARLRGIQVYLDTYTYESYGNRATVALVPHWALVDEGVDIGGQDGGLARALDNPYLDAKENLQHRLADPDLAYRIRRDIAYEITKAGGAERVLIIEHPNPSYLGASLSDVARMHDEYPIDRRHPAPDGGIGRSRRWRRLPRHEHRRDGQRGDHPEGLRHVLHGRRRNHVRRGVSASALLWHLPADSQAIRDRTASHRPAVRHPGDDVAAGQHHRPGGPRDDPRRQLG